MTQVAVSLFKRTGRTRTFQEEHSFPVRATTDEPYDIVAGMRLVVQQIRESNGPRLVHFNKLDKSETEHGKSVLSRVTAVQLEYPLSAEKQVNKRLQELDYTYFTMQTEKDGKNTITFVFPLCDAITDVQNQQSNKQSRIASCLMHDIGVTGASEGCNSVTFQVELHSTSRITAFPLAGLIDPESYIHRTRDPRFYPKDCSKYWIGAGKAYVPPVVAPVSAPDINSDLFQF